MDFAMLGLLSICILLTICVVEFCEFQTKDKE